MNSLFLINKKYILFLSILSIFVIGIFFYLKFDTFDKKNLKGSIKISNVDITLPKFSINNEGKKIFVTAKEGNFVDENKILLNKNVKFKSDTFIIETDQVIFNRKDQTATSQSMSVFKSKNASIFSEGFDIYDNGKKISFSGNAQLILK